MLYHGYYEINGSKCVMVTDSVDTFPPEAHDVTWYGDSALAKTLRYAARGMERLGYLVTIDTSVLHYETPEPTPTPGAPLAAPNPTCARCHMVIVAEEGDTCANIPHWQRGAFPYCTEPEPPMSHAAREAAQRADEAAWLPMAGGSGEAPRCYDCGAPVTTRDAWIDTDGHLRCSQHHMARGWQGPPPLMAGGAPSHYTDPAWHADEAWALQAERNAESAREEAMCGRCGGACHAGMAWCPPCSDAERAALTEATHLSYQTVLPCGRMFCWTAHQFGHMDIVMNQTEATALYGADAVRAARNAEGRAVPITPEEPCPSASPTSLASPSDAIPTSAPTVSTTTTAAASTVPPSPATADSTAAAAVTVSCQGCMDSYLTPDGGDCSCRPCDETLIAALEDYLAPINQGGGSIPRLMALEDAFAAWKDEQPAPHTHPCPTCHQARPCTGTGCADEPRECNTCSNCRGW